MAVSAIRDFLADNDLDVYLAVFDKESFVVSEQLLGEVADSIDEHCVGEIPARRRKLLDVERKALEEAEIIQFDVRSARYPGRNTG